MTTNKTILAALSLGLGLAALSSTLCPSTAHAYRALTLDGSTIRWPGPLAVMMMNPSLTHDYRASLFGASDRWNDSPSKFRFIMLVDDDSTSALDNGENEIAFTSSASILGGKPALCYRWVNSDGFITETDIFAATSESYTWSGHTYDLWPYGGDSRPFQTTMIHELGHALGLNHENRFYNIMGSDWNHIHANGWNAQPYVGEDASNGAVSLYGVVSSGYEDVGVVHWKYDPNTTGEYSHHVRTGVYSSTGALLPASYVSGEPHYEVSKGQAVQMEVTFENNGRSTQAPSYHVYLDDDDMVVPIGTLLRTGAVTLNRNVPDTFKLPVTIPSNLQSGELYWLGVILDKDHAITERLEANNATYIGIKVK